MADTVDFSRIREYEESNDILDIKLDQLASYIQEANYVVFFTGAGVSTSAGVPDYRGPKGCWTMKAQGKRAKSKVSMVDAQPTTTHMAMSTLIRKGLAHYVVTTNLDGVHRKSGLKQHTQICNLHGCIYVERCTGCGYDFERNWHVRRNDIHVHDHIVGVCERCGSRPPTNGRRVGTTDKNVGTKDTHINFGEYLDDIEWNDADTACGQADLVIVAGTSMSLRHITHLPFKAHKNGGKVVIINLQKTPDDDKCDLRIFAKTDPIFIGLMKRLEIPIDPIPVWRPRDAKSIDQIPSYVHPHYVKAAERLEALANVRESELMMMSQNNTNNNESIKKKKKKKEKEGAMKVDESKVTIQIGNECVKRQHTLSSNKFKWKLFVRGDGVEQIERVKFELHPTFDPSTIIVEAPPFELERVGWGTFDVNVYVQRKGNKKWKKFVHPLKFDVGNTAKSYNLL